MMCHVCGMEPENEQHLVTCPDDCGAHDYVPSPCRLDHDTMRKEAIDKDTTPPVDCPECGESLVVRG